MAELRFSGTLLRQDIGHRIPPRIRVDPGEALLIQRPHLDSSGSTSITIQPPLRVEKLVSRRHAQLCCEPGSIGLSVIDLASLNGTYLNGVRVVANLRTPLHVGDRLAFGIPGGHLLSAGEAFADIKPCIEYTVVHSIGPADAEPTNSRPKRTNTILEAATVGAEALSLLLDRGACPFVSDERGATALHLSVASENLETLLLLLTRKLVPVDARDVDGSTALHIASASPSLASAEMVELLISHRASVGARDADGLSPLLLAAQHGSANSVHALLLAGADRSEVCNAGHDAFSYCADRDDASRRTFEALLGNTEAQMMASAQAHTEALEDAAVPPCNMRAGVSHRISDADSNRRWYDQRIALPRRVIKERQMEVAEESDTARRSRRARSPVQREERKMKRKTVCDSSHSTPACTPALSHVATTSSRVTRSRNSGDLGTAPSFGTSPPGITERRVSKDAPFRLPAAVAPVSVEVEAKPAEAKPRPRSQPQACISSQTPVLPPSAALAKIVEDGVLIAAVDLQALKSSTHVRTLVSAGFVLTERVRNGKVELRICKEALHYTKDRDAYLVSPPRPADKAWLPLLRELQELGLVRVGAGTDEYYSAALHRLGLRTGVPDEHAPAEAYELEALMDSLVPPAGLRLTDGLAGLAKLARPLFDFQQEGVRWMIEREVGRATAEELLHPLWDELLLESGHRVYMNRVTGTLSSYKFLAPPAEPGGCLADEMGLGKTAMMLGLFASNPRDFSKADPSRSAAIMASLDQPPEEVKATLVVLPQTLLSQWKDEAKIWAPKLKVFKFKGCKYWEEDEIVARFKTADVVLTTYNQLAQMARSRGGALLRVQWWRVVLDEAQVRRIDRFESRRSHLGFSDGLQRFLKGGCDGVGTVACEWLVRVRSYLRRFDTLFSRGMACCRIVLDRRCCTGTPLSKNLGDVHGLLVFLDHDPFADDVVLRSELIKPYEARKAGVLDKMRGLLARFMLHRSKLSVQPQIYVPEIIEEEVRVTLTPTERVMYDELFKKTRSTLEEELLAVQIKESKAKTDVAQLHQQQLNKLDELENKPVKKRPTAVADSRLNDAVRTLTYIEAQMSEAKVSALPNRWVHALSNIKYWLTPSTNPRVASKPKGLLAASGQLAMTAPLRASLTELRQLCCHVGLVRQSQTGTPIVSVSEALDRLIAERQLELEPLERALQRMPEPTTASLQRARQRATATIEDKRRMLSFLTQRREQTLSALSAANENGANDQCAICLESFDDAIMTPCGHMFCYQCILGAAQGGSAPCPHCRAAISLSELVHVVQAAVPLSQDGCGAKLSKLVELIKRERSSAYKCIVFSQWTRLLDLTSYALNTAQIQNIGCYGSSEEERALAIDKFKKEQDCTVLLINLRSSSASAAAGLNLTEASDVYLLEPCLNFGLEAQAIARVNRIGQTKQTRVRRLISAATIEEDIVKMQAKSKKLQGKGCTSGDEDMQAHAIAAMFGLGLRVPMG